MSLNDEAVEFPIIFFVKVVIILSHAISTCLIPEPNIALFLLHAIIFKTRVRVCLNAWVFVKSRLFL
jgi:hypothetical protein